MDFANMPFGELAGWAAAGVAVLSTIIEITPIKLNPWKKLARWVGRAINGDILDEVADLKVEFMDMKAVQDERNAKMARTRVLRFGDELYHDVYHSKEHFENVLEDIREYEAYCDSHPKFKNDRMRATAQLIRDTYTECLREHKFK
ncbi:MAG: hypothetical protein IJP02_06390 [Oscillospiraceae bacterium]|nr:hypothetical protein [Oscillospiraceae bacterium]